MNQACDNLLALKALLRTVQAAAKICKAADTYEQQAEARLKERSIMQSGDVYAITCGEPIGTPGGTNMLKICRAR